MKNIIIFGGTGFIGRHLVDELKGDYKIIILSRNPPKIQAENNKSLSIVKLDFNRPESAIPYFNRADGIVNLAGENIGGGRWTESFKNKIMDSRLSIARFINEAFLKCENKPGFLIHGSAIGYYGTAASDEDVFEDMESKEDSFLTNVAVHYENSMQGLQILTRLVYARTGIVLDKHEGALPKMAKPFKKYVGGKIGNGQQWISWIHIKDLVRGIRFVIENENLTGPVNLTAPYPVIQKRFAKLLGNELKKPTFMRTPAFVLELVIGMERAQNLVLGGLKVMPKKLIEEGFSFQFETLEDTLTTIYKD